MITNVKPKIKFKRLDEETLIIADVPYPVSEWAEAAIREDAAWKANLKLIAEVKALLNSKLGYDG